MSDMIPKGPNRLKLFAYRNQKPITFIGVTILILIIGLFIPGITDEIVLEVAFILIAAFSQIKAKINTPKE